MHVLAWREWRRSEMERTVTMSSGMPPSRAYDKAVLVLVAPGPSVVKTTDSCARRARSSLQRLACCGSPACLTLPVSLPYVAAMNAALASWRVVTSCKLLVRMDSKKSRFSSPAQATQGTLSWAAGFHVRRAALTWHAEDIFHALVLQRLHQQVRSLVRWRALVHTEDIGGHSPRLHGPCDGRLGLQLSGVLVCNSA